MSTQQQQRGWVTKLKGQKFTAVCEFRPRLRCRLTSSDQLLDVNGKEGERGGWRGGGMGG